MASNIVALLERIGGSSQLHTLSGERLAQELSSAGVSPAVQSAILRQQPRQLEELIGASRNVCCLIHAPQDDEPQDEAPSKDGDEVRNRVEFKQGEFAQDRANRHVANAA